MKKKVQKLYETTNQNNERFITACLSAPECELYCASDDTKSVYIWKKGKETPILQLAGHSSSVSSLLLRTPEAELYSGLKGGMVVIWDLESSRVKYNLQGHSTIITAMNLHIGGGTPQILASASGDGKIKIWDLKGKSASLNLKGHLEEIETLAISPDCSLLASGAQDGLVKLWDLRSTKLLKEFTILDQNTVNCVEFNPHSITLAYGSKDKTIKHWDLERYTLISVTPYDRLPIERIKFDSTGKNIFSATNESMKYWMVDDNEPILMDMTEAGWNKLQDFQYIDKESINALSTFGNKIAYWVVPYDYIISNKSQSSQKKSSAASDLIQEFENVGKGIGNNSNMNMNYNNINSNSNNIQVPSNMKINNNYQASKISDINLFSTEGFLNNNQTENIFVKNALNVLSAMNSNSQAPACQTSNLNQNQIGSPLKKEIILQKNVVINNINSNVNLSSIQNANDPDDTFLDYEALMGVDFRRNSDNISYMLSNNVVNTSTTSFNSIKTSETMGIDLNKFINNNNPDETIHVVSQTNDLPILQEVLDQHSAMKGAIAKRYNSLKMVSKWWSDSNISSTLNALSLMKDLSVVNDFFTFAIIARGDVSKIPFTLDHSISILPHILALINSKYEAYCRTGCKVGMIFLKLLNDKIVMAKGAAINNSDIGMDPFREERIRKCDQIIDLFNQIYKSNNLAKLCKRIKNVEICEAANGLYTDLEFFLKPFKK